MGSIVFFISSIIYIGNNFGNNEIIHAGGVLEYNIALISRCNIHMYCDATSNCILYFYINTMSANARFPPTDFDISPLNDESDIL